MSDATRKRGLGRGLGALIVSTDPTMPSPSGDAEGHGEHGERSQGSEVGIHLVPVASIAPNPRQPRTHFPEEALLELAASIREHGIIQPLVVTGNPQRAGHYWLVAGERRWRAAQRAGLESVPALVREASPQQLVELALIENVQRADLNALEEAAAYQSLIDEFHLTQAEVADRVGKSRSAVANTVRLLGLPAAVQEMLAAGTLSAGHGRALLALPTPEAMSSAMGEILHRDLNVRQTEALVKRLLDAALQPPPPPEPEPSAQLRAQLAHMEERFRSALGTRVALNRNADGSGRLVVHFFNDSDLEAIYQLIAGEEGDE